MSVLFNKGFSFLRKHKAFAAALGMGVLLLLFISPISFYRLHSSYCCSGCLSGREVNQWFFGSWQDLSIPLSPKYTDFKGSCTYTNFVSSHHEHTWVLAQESPYYLGLRWGGCAVGPLGYMNEFAALYERSEDFRHFLVNRENQKRLGHEQILNLLILPFHLSLLSTNYSMYRQNRRLSDELRDDFYHHRTN